MARMALGIGISLMVVATLLYLLHSDTRAATFDVEANASNFFEPQDITIAAGDTVRWTVVGGVPHDVTSDPVAADDGEFPSSGTFVAGDPPYQVTFSTAGEFIYYCTIHAGTNQYPGGMTGKVTVQAAQATATNTSTAPTATRTPGASSTPSRTPTGTVTVALSATPVATSTALPATPFVAAPISGTEPAGGAGVAITAPQTGTGVVRGRGWTGALAVAFAIGGVALAGMSMVLRRRA